MDEWKEWLKNLNDLNVAHWQFRLLMIDHSLWLTPDQAGAASCAMQEIGAALDAGSRPQRQGGRRNGRRPDQADELADCWFMLAAMWGIRPIPYLAYPKPLTLKHIAFHVAAAAYYHERLDGRWELHLVAALYMIPLYIESLGRSPEKIFRARLLRTFKKRVAEELDMASGKLRDLRLSVDAILDVAVS